MEMVHIILSGVFMEVSCWTQYPVWQHTFVSPSVFSRRAVVSYWRRYVREVLVNRLGGLSLPRKSVVRLTERPDMTLDVYRGRKTTLQQHVGHFHLCGLVLPGNCRIPIWKLEIQGFAMYNSFI